MLDKIELLKSAKDLEPTAPKTAARFEALLDELQRPLLDLLAEAFEVVSGRAPDSKFDLVAASWHPATIRALRLKLKALGRDMREHLPGFETSMQALDSTEVDFDPAQSVERDTKAERKP